MKRFLFIPLVLFLACEDKQEKDCAEEWGGDAIVDMCDTCDDDSSNNCIQDCNGDFGGTATLDNCGTCDSDTENDCVQDCAGEWGGTAVEDCAGVCGGIFENDSCGVCQNPNDSSWNSSCSGCMDEDAFNYDPNATIDDGSCEYPAADIVVSLSPLEYSGDCNSCNSSDNCNIGYACAVCYSCTQIVLDYSVENIGTATAYNVNVRFKVEYTSYTNIPLPQTITWFSDIINLYSLNPGEIASGSIVAVDYSYYDGINLTTRLQVRVYLVHLTYDGD